MVEFSWIIILLHNTEFCVNLKPGKTKEDKLWVKKPKGDDSP